MTHDPPDPDRTAPDANPDRAAPDADPEAQPDDRRSGHEDQPASADSEPSGTRRDVLRAGAAAGAGALALGAGLPTSAQTVVEENCEQGATFSVGDGNFEVINNQWSNPSATQCIQRYDDGSYGWTFEGGSGDINYPEVYVGGRPWGSDTGVPEFPLPRGEVEELTMTWDFDIDVESGEEWNLAEEWWLLDGQPASNNPPLTHEVMLVLDWSPQHSHGEPIETNAWTDRFGNQIDYWAFYNEGGTSADFHIFRINGKASAGQVDLLEIVAFLNEQENVRDDLTLTGIELGTETFDGPDGEVVVDQFDVTINGTTYTSGSGGDVGNGDDTTAPTTPSNLSETGTTADSVDVAWDPAADSGGSVLSHYAISVDGSQNQTVPAGTTSATVDGLSADTNYEIAVTATDGAGNESDAATISATTDEDGGEDPPEEPPADALVVNDYDGDPAWPGQNDLGNWAGAGSFANGGGTGEVVDGALELQYQNAGWLVEQVQQDVSEFSSLVFEVSGASGGEGDHFTVSVGGARGTFADLADGSIGTSTSAVSIDLVDAGVDQSSPGELRLNFWEGSSGASTIAIEAIRFE